MVHERLRPSEEERKRRLQLSRYTSRGSYAILTNEGKTPLGTIIPDSTIASFYTNQMEDRGAYWNKNAPGISFGQRMVEWLDGTEERPGIMDWVEAQKQQNDPAVLAILQRVGLTSESQEKINTDLQDPAVIKLIGAINKDLEKTGGEVFTEENILEKEALGLIFYARFLSGQKGQGESRDFIDTLVDAARKESNGNVDEAIAHLQKVAPLFLSAGEEGQYALAALTVAKVHATDSQDTLQHVDPNAVLNEDEAYALAFLKRDQEGSVETTKPLEAGKAHNVQEVFEKLTPEPSPGHKYWVEEVPTGFAEKLTPEQLHALELQKPFFLNVRFERTPQGGFIRQDLNKDVFDPAYTLANDVRFQNGELLTENDSGLFALVAASTSSPEQQVLLYQQLGETVLRAHIENRNLLEEFLQAQPEGSREALMANEADIFMPSLFTKRADLLENIEQSFQEKFHSDRVETEEQGQYRDELFDTAEKQLAAFSMDIYENIAKSQDRLFAVVPKEVPLGAIEQLPFDIDIPKTVAAWPERVKALQEALRQEPLELTPEQIRQIEFLAHSIDIATLIDWMQHGLPQEGSLVGPSMPPDLAPMALAATAVSQQSETMPTRENGEEVPISGAIEEMEITTMSLSEVFNEFNDLEASVIPTGILPRRKDFEVTKPEELRVFHTLYEDVRGLEVTNDKRELYLWGLKKGENVSQIEENSHDPFMLTLFVENSMSHYIFNQFNEISHGKFGPNTLLAYVLEASPNASQQEQLFKSLFAQVADIYKTHDEVRESMKQYLIGLNDTTRFEQSEQAHRLFDSEAVTAQHLDELTTKLSNDQQLTMEDFSDMAWYSLPFNLQTLVERMNLAYRSSETELPVGTE